MGQKYRIHVGTKRSGSNAVAGYLARDKANGGTRNDIIQGTPTPVTIRSGSFGIPNGTQAWGVRLDKNGKVPENTLRVDDDAYKGKIKWMKWGAEGGTMIRCRWLSGYDTIDKDYQDTRLLVKIVDGFTEGGEPISLILFRHGYNEYDENSDKALVEMLKIHHHNAQSVSCNPDAEGGMFSEVNETETTDDRTKLIETKGECLLLVSAASNKPESIRNLFDIVKDLNKSATVHKEDASEVYKWLQTYADEDPQGFSNKVNQYKTNVSTIFEKAKSYQVLDLTKDGFIAAGEKKKEIILQDIPAKGEEMLDWAFSHCMEPGVYEGIEKLQKITDNLK